MQSHQPVLLSEVISALNIKPNGVYLDLTLGRAGHASVILKHLKTGSLIAFDQDAQAIIESGQLLQSTSANVKLIHANFKYLKQELAKLNLDQVDGILADLGVSSPQIDQAQRGFSYQQDGPLDMRMNQSSELTAHLIVNEYSEEALVNMLRENADVMLPQRVAKGIIAQRPIASTLSLVDVIRKSLPAAVVRQKNPAKAVFQAIRIAVNEELAVLKTLLDEAPSLLKPGGVLAIISFHSLEDRMIKQAFAKYVVDNTGKLPIQVVRHWKVKTIHPSASEVSQNRRSRSAKLRVLTKLED